MYYGSIDLSKIDKTKIVSTDKNGKPFENGAKYLNVVVWINEDPDQYGNHASIQESISKEERDSGAKGSYIGNLKTNDVTPPPPPKKQGEQQKKNNYDPNLGF